MNPPTITRKELTKTVISELAREIVEFLLPQDEPNYVNVAKINGLKEMTDQITNFKSGLTGACMGGHVKLATSMIQKNEALNPGTTDFSGCLYQAGLNGHIKIVNLMLTYGSAGLEWGFYGACEGGFINIVKLILKTNQLQNGTSWSRILYQGFSRVCLGGNLELTKLMMEYDVCDLNYGMYQACLGGSIQIAELMIAKGADDFNSGLEGACWYKQKELVALMIEKGATECSTCNKSIKFHSELK